MRYRLRPIADTSDWSAWLYESDADVDAQSKTKMSKKYTFDISNNRLLTIAKKYDQLCIEEKSIVKSATFTPSCWASFLLCLDKINLKSLRLEKMLPIIVTMEEGDASR